MQINVSLGKVILRVRKAKKQESKPNLRTFGRDDAGQYWLEDTMEVAEGCIPDQNRPPNLILASAWAVDFLVNH